jgi:hypothetical protein
VSENNTCYFPYRPMGFVSRPNHLDRGRLKMGRYASILNITLNVLTVRAY